MTRHATTRVFFLSLAFLLSAASSRGQVSLQASGLADPDTCTIGGAGDNDSDVEPGERINMSVGADNFGVDDANNVRVTTSTTTPGIAILTSPPVSTAALVTPGIPVITIPQIVYTVDACTVPCGSSITFRFDIESDEGNFSNTFTETVPAGASCNRCVTGNLGSCCHDDGRCSECTRADCSSRGWSYGGDGTDCTTEPCVSACCNGAVCTPDTRRTTCEAAGGGRWLYPPTSCVPNPCSTVGACCVGATCSTTSSSACSGTYLGDGTSCPQLRLGRNSWRLTRDPVDCPAPNQVKALWRPTPSQTFEADTRFNVHQVVGFGNRTMIANPYPPATTLLPGIAGTDSPAFPGGRETCVTSDEPMSPAVVAYLAVFQANRCSGASLADP